MFPELEAPISLTAGSEIYQQADQPAAARRTAGLD